MPLNYSDMESLLFAANNYGFRKPNEEEKEKDYRIALSNHVRSLDIIESYKIKYGARKQWTPAQQIEVLVEGSKVDKKINK